jgi:DNA-binding response OmpR family regulator
VAQHGYRADCVFDGKTAEEYLLRESQSYEAVILDLMLPQKDGFALCKNIREKKITVPMVVLCARNSIDYKVTALDAGADDYLVKPFSMDELMARLRAILRRPSGVFSSRLQCGPLVLETFAKKTFLDGRAIQLRPKEFALLECLLRHPLMVVSRKQLIETVWGKEKTISSNVIDAHIKNLRQKLNSYGEDSLKTIHGIGYCINE